MLKANEPCNRTVLKISTRRLSDDFFSSSSADELVRQNY